MRNIWHIFTSEVKLLGTNVTTLLLTISLIILPALFTWYNVLACWDVFDNTGNLQVAVANSDEGYESDLIPVSVNLGDRVIAALRAHDKIGWVFVDEAEAIEGAASGKYYASVVIPKNFSEAMLTFYQAKTDDTDDGAEIIYYSNEKKNAIAPKIAGQGADSVAYSVNDAFAATVSKIAFATAKSLNSYFEDADASSQVYDLAKSLDKAADRLGQASDLLYLYGGLASSSQDVIDSSAKMVDTAENATAEILDQSKQSASDAGKLVDSLSGAYEQMDSALESTIESLKKMRDSVQNAASGTQEDISQVRVMKDSISGQRAGYDSAITALEADPVANERTIAALTTANAQLEKVESTLDSSIFALQATGAAGDTAAKKEAIEEAIASFEEARRVYQDEIKPALEPLKQEIVTLSAMINELAPTLLGATVDLSDAISETGAKMGSVANSMNTTAAKFADVANSLKETSTSITEALESDNLQLVKEILSADVNTLSLALSAPVTTERNAIYPSENFGSSMLPLYASLAMFVGSLLLFILFKPTVSVRVMQSFPKDRQPTLRQQFIGHFLFLGCISLAQTTNLAFGSMMFVGVQVEHPLLFLLCFWVGGLVFAFVMYSLVSSLANIGKSIGVILLVIQVTGGGGSFPLALLPDFVQTLSPFLPAYHICNAMRAAMFGIYANDFWIELGAIALFAVPPLIFCLALIKPLRAFYTHYVAKAQRTKLLS